MATETPAQLKRDADVLAFITKRKSASRATLLNELGARCGPKRAIVTTLARLERAEKITFVPAQEQQAERGRLVGIYKPV